MNYYYDFTISDDVETGLEEAYSDYYDNFVLPSQVLEAVAEEEALAPIRDLYRDDKAA